MTTDETLVPLRSTRSTPVVFGAGAAIGVLGGMIGLGGAEFRLPLLIGLFGFAALGYLQQRRSQRWRRARLVPAGTSEVSFPYGASAWRGGQLALGAAWPMSFARRAGLYAEYRLTGG